MTVPGGLGQTNETMEPTPAASSEASAPHSVKAAFARWAWRPPRRHGDTIPDRTVSVLELFYDLVFVALISQAAHHLSEDVSVNVVVEFGVVMALIWIAWFSGTLYLELHGRQDGRTRLIVFVQMSILALIAVFTATAGSEGGASFAVAYAALLGVMTWLWDSVRRQDLVGRPEFAAETGIFVVGLGVSAAAFLVSAQLPAEPRLVIWAGVATTFFVAMLALGRWGTGITRGLPPTESLVERFSLFTIIVLGEVVVGVVNGLNAAQHDPMTLATGILALVVGFGFWWIYFDLVGRRLPRPTGTALVAWMLGHFPLALAIAAAGAAMVGLIGHSHDVVSPAPVAWLMAGSVALALLALVPIERALVDAERLADVYRPLAPVLGAGAVLALVVGWLRPAPWLVALLLVLILSAIWFFAVGRFLRTGAWGDG